MTARRLLVRRVLVGRREARITRDRARRWLSARAHRRELHEQVLHRRVAAALATASAVPCTRDAPARTAASALPSARPRSLWPCQSTRQCRAWCSCANSTTRAHAPRIGVPDGVADADPTRALSERLGPERLEDVGRRPRRVLGHEAERQTRRARDARRLAHAPREKRQVPAFDARADRRRADERVDLDGLLRALGSRRDVRDVGLGRAGRRRRRDLEPLFADHARELRDVTPRALARRGQPERHGVDLERAHRADELDLPRERGVLGVGRLEAVAQRLVGDLLPRPALVRR